MWYEKLYLSPHYRVISVEHLSDSLKERYACLKTKGMYGLLHPEAHSGLLPKPIDASLAEFIRAKESGSYFGVSVSSYFLKAIRALVVDGALGLPYGSDFATGISILDECGGLKEWRQDVHDDLYTHVLPVRQYDHIHTVKELSEVLYTGSHHEEVPAEAASIVSRLCSLADSFEFRIIDHDLGDSWQLATTKGYHQSLDTAGHYKLYICPQASALAEIAEPLFRLVKEHQPTFFKWIASEDGLRRPEKCVAYFNNLHALSDFVDDLLDTIGEVPGHHLPFSCPLERNNILYWGVNPFHSCSLFYSLSPGSWRRFVCDRIATAILLGRNDPYRTLEMDDYIVHYLYEVGIHPLYWLPVEESEMGLATKGKISSDRRQTEQR